LVGKSVYLIPVSIQSAVTVRDLVIVVKLADNSCVAISDFNKKSDIALWPPPPNST
jgi:hypothetical protein